MANTFCHIELNTTDARKAAAFYKKLFTWKIGATPGMPGYQMIQTGSKDVGGGVQNKPMPEAPTAWLPYVEVVDVAKSLAKAKKLGATVVMEPMPIPGMGVIGVFVDPMGAGLGVWAPEKKAKRAAKKR